jgi:hypothetical protein
MASIQVGTEIPESSEFDFCLTLRIQGSAHNINTSFLYAFMMKKKISFIHMNIIVNKQFIINLSSY